MVAAEAAIQEVAVAAVIHPADFREAAVQWAFLQEAGALQHRAAALRHVPVLHRVLVMHRVPGFQPRVVGLPGVA